jgi:hypothetical protein
MYGNGRCGESAIDFGSFACSSLMNRAAALLHHEQPIVFDNKQCTGTPSTIDLSGTFRLDDPTDGIRNY